MKIKSERIYRAQRIGRDIERPPRYECEDRIGKLSADMLGKHFLCKGTNSPCAIQGVCECLDACRFGQRYIELTRKEQL